MAIAAIMKCAADAATLRRVLLTNAGLSGAAGLALVFGAKPLAALLGGLPPVALMAVGVGLVLFAAGVFGAARRAGLREAEVRAVVAADVAWVVASAALLVLWPDLLSTAGRWIVGLCAVGVADFAVLQYLGLRGLTASRRAGRDAAGRPPGAVFAAES